MEEYPATGRLEMSKYAVVIEKSSNGYGAYVPDLPGCVAVGETAEEAEQIIRQSIGLHLEALRNDGDPVPEPTTRVRELDVA